MKKVLSLILALSLIISIFSVVSLSATAQAVLDENKAYIKVGENYYEVEKGEIYTYTYYLNVPDVRISSFDAHTFYDTQGLDFIPAMDEYGDDDLSSMFPVFKTVVLNYVTIDGSLFYNYASTRSVKLQDENSIAFTGDFLVTEDSGVFEIKTELITLADSKMNKLKYDGVVYGGYTERFEMTDLVPIENATQEETNPSQETTQPTEEITEPQQPTVETEPTQPVTDPSETPTQEETKATEPPTDKPTTAEKVIVKADGISYEMKQGDTFTYVYNLACSEKISAIHAETLYSASGLEFVPDTDDFGDYDLLTMFPVLKDVVSNFKISGRIVYNYSSIAGSNFPMVDDSAYTKNNRVFVGKFKVTESSGTYEINTRIKTLGDMNAKRIIYNYEHVNENIAVNCGGMIFTDGIPEETTPPSEEVTQPTQPATDPSEIPTESETLETVAPTQMPTTDTPQDVMYGDVNGDGKVSIFDVSFVQKYVAGIDGYELDERAFTAGNVNFDDKVNIFDASRIQKFIAGYFETFE